jgi:hypothetical protein
MTYLVKKTVEFRKSIVLHDLRRCERRLTTTEWNVDGMLVWFGLVFATNDDGEGTKTMTRQSHSKVWVRDGNEQIGWWLRNYARMRFRREAVVKRLASDLRVRCGTWDAGNACTGPLPPCMRESGKMRKTLNA